MFKSMKTIFVTLLLLINSCTFYRTAADYGTESDFYYSINQQANGRDAYITFFNDSVVVGTNYIISADSSYWKDKNHENNLQQSNTIISDITFRHPTRGMINGFLFGGAAAMILAAPILHFSKDEFEFEDEFAPIMVLTGVGFIGSITGAIIGYNVSDKHVYELNQCK